MAKLNQAYQETYSASDMQKYSKLLGLLKKIVRSKQVLNGYKIPVKRLYLKFKKLTSLNEGIESPEKESQSPTKDHEEPSEVVEAS